MAESGERGFIQFGVRLIGVVYVVLGLVGFLPVDAINPLHSSGIGAHYLLNLVAINWAHNLIHLGIGAYGVWASADLARCRMWGRVTGVVLIVVFAVGVAQAAMLGFPVDQLLFGLVPLNSPGHMLHIATGGAALYLGFARETEVS